ncbi:FtsK/SpoIIIE domain-containing protein [Herpetosiphon giganteus]|uniref:FtsK/SpoIIIE domain-containing protein n=1 Tax=Herpetosiphon giganteus TaxID=2029754 RepID=UPI00195AD63A|nr:FtsK/SpoIIIE domain-containing protein [Herpetosiphon giganteus]MBM7842185.1 hypothetical protein [Herpetosiphon giganteus]
MTDAWYDSDRSTQGDTDSLPTIVQTTSFQPQKIPLTSPSFDMALDVLPSDTLTSYPFPLGWYIDEVDDDRLSFHLACANLLTTHSIGIFGPKRYGKTTVVNTGILSLILNRSSKEIQFIIIDLKNLDFMQLKNSSYTYYYASTITDFEKSIGLIYQEILNRIKLFEQLNIISWKDYPEDDLPLIVIYLTDIPLLSLCIGEDTLNEWIKMLITFAPNFGFRVIIDSIYSNQIYHQWYTLLDTHILGPIPKEIHPIIYRYTTKDIPNTSIIHTKMVLDLPYSYQGLFSMINDNGQRKLIRSIYSNESLIHESD